MRINFWEIIVIAVILSWAETANKEKTSWAYQIGKDIKKFTTEFNKGFEGEKQREPNQA